MPAMRKSLPALLLVPAVGAALLITGLAAGERAPTARSSTARTATLASASDRLVIHEWGTFTCLQDETGRAISGVNTDDEPVPDFVHRISDLIPRPSELAPIYDKSVPRSHPQVFVRLE